MDVYVTVVPVSVRSISSHPKSCALMRADASVDDPEPWCSTRLGDGLDPRRVAQQLLDEQLSLLPQVRVPWKTTVEQVGFRATRKRIDLLYTAACPIMWADAEIVATIATAEGVPDWMGRWQDLTKPPKRGEDNRRLLGYPLDRIYTHWRQRLEEETAAILFLPQYFTMNQMAAIYDAFWFTNASANVSNFWRWSERAFAFKAGGDDRRIRPLSSDETEQIAQITERRITDTAGKALGNQIVAQARMSQAFTGPVLAAGGLAGLAVLAGGPVGLAAAAAATVGIGSMRASRRGKPSTWFTSPVDLGASTRGHHLLEQKYPQQPQIVPVVEST